MVDDIKKTILIFFAVVAALGLALKCAYEFGRSDGIEYEQQKRQIAIEEVQNELKVKYETAQKNLIASHDAERSLYDERMRQLESYRHAAGSLEACASDRERALRLAISGEKLLKRADGYLEAFEK